MDFFLVKGKLLQHISVCIKTFMKYYLDKQNSKLKQTLNFLFFDYIYFIKF